MVIRIIVYIWLDFRADYSKQALVQINLNSKKKKPMRYTGEYWGAMEPKQTELNFITPKPNQTEVKWNFNIEGICILKGNYWLHLIMTAVLNLYSSLRK